MPKYEVTIRMTITKTYIVEAENREDAIDATYEIATVLSEDGIDEDYSEDIMNAVKITETQGE